MDCTKTLYIVKHFVSKLFHIHINIFTLEDAKNRNLNLNLLNRVVSMKRNFSGFIWDTNDVSC